MTIPYRSAEDEVAPKLYARMPSSPMEWIGSIGSGFALHCKHGSAHLLSFAQFLAPNEFL